MYTYAKKDYTGQVSVPVLFDVTADTIVSNESVCREEREEGEREEREGKTERRRGDKEEA